MHIDKKAHLLSTALQLFAQKGFQGTTVRDIANEADVNLAMINYYFGSKEKLFQSAIEYKASHLKSVFEELINNEQLSPIDKIGVIIDKYVERIFTNPSFHHLLHRELSLEQRSPMHDRIIEILLKNVSFISQIIEDGIERKIFRPVDPQLTIASLIGTINQLGLSEIFCIKLLKKGKNFNPYANKKFKERVSNHLKQMMSAHLIIKQNV